MGPDYAFLARYFNLLTHNYRFLLFLQLFANMEITYPKWVYYMGSKRLN